MDDHRYIAICDKCFGRRTISGYLGFEERCRSCGGSGIRVLNQGKEYNCGFHNESFILDPKTWERHKSYPPCLPIPTFEVPRKRRISSI